MNFFKALIITLLLHLIGIFYGIFILLSMIFDTFRFGTTIWEKKNRRKNKPPSCYFSWTPSKNRGLDKVAWNHYYVRTRGLRFHCVTAGELPKHLKKNKVDNEIMIGEGTFANSGKRPKLILCLHGFPESWFSWRYILKSFQEQPTIKRKNGGGDETNYFMVAVDMRGFGESDHPDGISSYHRNETSADVKAIVNALGYEKCILLGHDWGGVVAWQVQESYTEVIESLVILNCPHPNAGVEFALSSPKQLLLNSWYMYFFTVPFLPELYISFNDFKFLDLIMSDKAAGIQNEDKKITCEEMEYMKYAFEGPNTRAGINYYRALLLPFHQPDEDGPKKHKSTEAEFPILLLWGENDIFMDRRMAEGTKKYLPKPAGGKIESKVVIVEKASHWLQQDAPELVDKHLREFLAE